MIGREDGMMRGREDEMMRGPEDERTRGCGGAGTGWSEDRRGKGGNSE
jgi:hypothetical protein